MSEVKEWFSAIDAAALLATRFGDLVAKETLMSRLEDGGLSLAAQLVIQEADVGEPALSPEFWQTETYFRSFSRQADRNYVLNGDGKLGLVELQKDIFAREQGWMFDTARSVWSRGIFLARRPAAFNPPLKLKRRLVVEKVGNAVSRPITPPPDASLRLVSLGLHFLKGEVASILTTSPPIGERPSGTENRGGEPRPPNSRTPPVCSEEHLADDDRPIFDELAAMIKAGQFQEVFGLPRRGLKAVIAREIERRMTERELYPPSEKTLLRRAGELMDIYKEALAKKSR